MLMKTFFLHAKQRILAIALLVAGSSVATWAVSPFLEFQPVQVGDGYTAFNIQGGVTTKVHPAISLGIGVGLTEEWNFSHGPLLPIFGRAEASGKIGGFNPFVSFDVGYEINTHDTHWGAVLVNPMVGLKFGRWYGGIGYLGHCWTPSGSGTTSCFNMKVGYTF